MHFTRRELIKTGSLLCLSTLLGCTKYSNIPLDMSEKEFEIFTASYTPYPLYFSDSKPIVSIVKVNDKWSDAKAIEYAVTKAIDLIGGLDQVTKGKERILLKPNLVGPAKTDTTKPLVIETLAVMMKQAGKNVCIGEASGGSKHNVKPNLRGRVCRTSNYKTLQDIQNDVFSQLGYVELSRRIDVPLINLHLGKMAKLDIADNFVFKEIHIHEALHNADMICSVPMMKTHSMAGVTLALKNIGIGAYPGIVYGAVKSGVHKKATEVEPTGTSTAIIDMVKANKIGLNVIDGTMAMQGQGPSVANGGKVLKMNLIFASTNALAADMVAADVMGFGANEIDTFKWAWKAGMTPHKTDDIQIVGERPADVRRPFERPRLVPYTAIKDWFGPPC